MPDFEKFCTVDLSLSEATVRDRSRQIKRFLRWMDGREISRESIRDYLNTFNGKAALTKANVVKAFRRFFRDFLGQGELVATFKLPQSEFKPKMIPTREQLQRFYAALQTPRDRALFLMYAATGLRREEVLSLTLGDIDLETRTVIPNMASTATKRRWVACFNQEAADALREYLNGHDHDPGVKAFGITGIHVDRIFKRASEASGVKITPQVLREWFACEMGELGVADRYVDAFCGRVPRSVLARHYTDFSPERLKRIYDGAGLKVL